MSKINPEQLIEEVKFRPILYDKSSPDYHNRFMVDKAWLEITQILGAESTEAVRSKWYMLRNSYRRELVTQHKRGSTKDVWYLAKNLSFLKNHLKTLTPTDNKDECSNEELVKNEPSNNDSEQNELDYLQDQPSSSPRQSLKRPRNDINGRSAKHGRSSNLDSPMMEMLDQRNVAMLNPGSGLGQFVDSCIAKFPFVRQLEVSRDIINVLLDHAMQTFGDETNGHLNSDES